MESLAYGVSYISWSVWTHKFEYSDFWYTTQSIEL